MSIQPTNFSGLAESEDKTARAYAAVKSSEDVTKTGDYQKNEDGIKKPFRLPIHPRPPILPIM
jgi:hypothetical protein